MLSTSIARLLTAPKQVSETQRETMRLRHIEKLLDEDKRLLSAHPVLKHLYERVAAVVLDSDYEGHPRTPIEPTREFVDRINKILTVRQSKDFVKQKAYRSKTTRKQQEQSRKKQHVQHPR